jgi:hypothetical protein
LWIKKVRFERFLDFYPQSGEFQGLFAMNMRGWGKSSLILVTFIEEERFMFGDYEFEKTLSFH